MQTTFALAALAAVAYGQGVTETIPPKTPAPAGCAASVPGTFEITAVNSTAVKRDLTKRGTPLILTLNNGVLLDAAARTGYIAANFQFQFDKPAQTGAIYTGGFSLCGNGSLALGGSAIWYECLSGDFYNLYDRSWAAQCEPILIVAVSQSGAGVGQASDGQPTGTTVGPAVSQISDGQPQGATPATIFPITQISDGQPQLPTPLISQISDGQPQVPTLKTTVAPISQISDGQPQAPSVTPAPISQISDGQPQAPTSTAGGAVITQISDGQPQAPNTTAPAPVSTASPSQVVGNGGSAFAIGSSFAAAVAGLAAVLLL